MFDIGSVLKKVQELGGRFNEIHEQLNQVNAKGSAAGGLVVVEVNGHQTMTTCKIDPSLFKSGDQELLEELVIAATNSAVAESRVKQNEIIQSFSDNGDLSQFGNILEKILSK
jgi:DNA-binding YbaB/EbfC family protein